MASFAVFKTILEMHPNSEVPSSSDWIFEFWMTDDTLQSQGVSSAMITVTSSNTANQVEVLIRDAIIAKALELFGITLPGSDVFTFAIRRN